MAKMFFDLKAAGKVKAKKEMAEELDVSYTHLVAVFTGSRELSGRIARALHRVYGVSIGAFEDGSPSSGHDFAAMQKQINELQQRVARLEEKSAGRAGSSKSARKPRQR